MTQPTMTIRAPETIQRELAGKAKHRGLTRNALVLMILLEWLKEQREEE